MAFVKTGRSVHLQGGVRTGTLELAMHRTARKCKGWGPANSVEKRPSKTPLRIDSLWYNVHRLGGAGGACIQPN